MTDILDPLLRAEGLDDDAIGRVHDGLRAKDAYVTVNYEVKWRREAEEETAKAKAAAEAMPDYHGAITQCQARVTKDMGRWTETYRCTKKPVKVRRTVETHGSYKGDGRLAVCGIHAKAKYGIDRWVKTGHWQDKQKSGTADEVVEPEYQP